MPLYEAVVNSIHAIEEDATRTRRTVSEYEITVTILRDETLLSSNGTRSEDRINGFLIRDNGCAQAACENEPESICLCAPSRNDSGSFLPPPSSAHRL